MERKYTKTVITNLWNNPKLKREKLYKFTRLRKGLKICHIGNDVWKVGRTNFVNDPSGEMCYNYYKKLVPKTITHCVIYGPNRKEYHVYGNDIDLLRTEYIPNYYNYSLSSNINRDGNDKIESSLKIYILTSILDIRSNWCFDLKNIPTLGKLKVIYHNGTIKNIDFNGVFESVKITSQGEYKSTSIIHPIAYRVC